LQLRLRYLGWLSFSTLRRLSEIVGDLAPFGGAGFVRVTRAKLSARFPEVPNDTRRAD